MTRAVGVTFVKGVGCNWPVLVGAFVVQLVLPCVLPAYGIMVVDLVEEELMPLFSSIWAPSLYVAAWAFSEPLCRLLTGWLRDSAGRFVALTGVALSSGGLVSSSFVHHSLYSFFGFGVLGGVGACLVRARLDAVLQQRFPRSPRALDMALNVASALGQFLSPLYTHFLLGHYGLQGTPLMLAGVVMQAAVGSLLLDCGATPAPPGTPPQQQQAHSTSPLPPPRPRASAFRGDSVDSTRDTSASPLVAAALGAHHKVSEDDRFVSDLPAEDVADTLRYRNAFGIDILPEIPEEGEEMDEDGKERCGAGPSARCVGEYLVEEPGGFQASLKSRAPPRSGKRPVPKGASLDGVPSGPGQRDKEQDRLLKPVPRSRMLLVDSSTVQDLSTSVKRGRGGWRFRCLCPHLPVLGEALRTPHALPSLLLAVSVRLCPVGFVALAPVAVRTHIADSTVDEAMLTVTISGFSWLCFLITMPWFLGMPSHRLKFLYSVGSFAAAAGLYLFSESTSHDQIILNCVIIGIGQGASLATSRKVVLDALGDSTVSRLSCVLDVATGILVLLAASIMGVFLGHEGGTTGCFVFLAVLQAASGLCWIVRPMMARFREHGHHDWSAGEFLHPS